MRVNSNLWVNTESTKHMELSTGACALLLFLWWAMNASNEINKNRFIKSINTKRDTRTWNKYWEELEYKDILVQLDKETWMVSPHECYLEGASVDALILKWENSKHESVS